MLFKALFSVVALVATVNAAVLAAEANVVALAVEANVVELEKRDASLVFFSGSGCTGGVITTFNGATSGECVFLTNGGSARSISFSGVPNQIEFFVSGGGHDICTNGFQAIASGSGCSTAPDG